MNLKTNDMKGFELVKRVYRWDLYNEDGHKIASTLDGCLNKLSTKNCQAIELGYDLDDLADEYSDVFDAFTDDRFDAYKAGFQKALELMSDKKFSEDDVLNLIKRSREKTPYNFDGKSTEYKFSKEEIIQSLQQTEWDVEIVMEEVSIGDKYTPEPKPKLDADGCLILKRVI